MRKLLNWFFQGLIFTAPIALTIYISYSVFSIIDRWLGIPIPGVGFVVTLALITLVGFLASNLLTRGIVAAVERLLERLPFVRLLYSSTRDLLNAFVGEKRRFDQPVAVELMPGGVHALGFVTQRTLAELGMGTHAAVYFPQSYNFAGQVLMVPVSRIAHLEAASSDVMAFIVSGGVTRLPTSPSSPAGSVPARAAATPAAPAV